MTSHSTTASLAPAHTQICWREFHQSRKRRIRRRYASRTIRGVNGVKCYGYRAISGPNLSRLVIAVALSDYGCLCLSKGEAGDMPCSHIEGAAALTHQEPTSYRGLTPPTSKASIVGRGAIVSHTTAGAGWDFRMGFMDLFKSLPSVRVRTFASDTLARLLLLFQYVWSERRLSCVLVAVA
jgi:hypothetical protein